MNTRTLTRYVALGDSLSEGVSDWGRGDTSIGFAPLLAGLLRQRQPDLQFTNFGVGGARVGDVLRGQVTRALALRPDLLTIVVGANDVPTTPETQFAREYTTMLTQLRAAADGLIVIANVPNFAHMLPQQFGPFRASVATRIKTFNAAIAAAAAEYGALLVDLEDAPAALDRRNISADGVHPNARGYRAMVAEFVQVLNSAGVDLTPPPLD